MAAGLRSATQPIEPTTTAPEPCSDATDQPWVSSLKVSATIARARLCKSAICGRHRLNLFSARGVPPSSTGSASAMLMNCCLIDSARGVDSVEREFSGGLSRHFFYLLNAFRKSRLQKEKPRRYARS
jgi:hypothetical protein